MKTTVTFKIMTKMSCFCWRNKIRKKKKSIQFLMKGGRVNDDRISFLGELLKIPCKTNNRSSFDTLVCLIIIKLFKIQYMTVSFSLMCNSLVVCPCSHQSIAKTTSTLWRITQRLLFTLPRGMDISGWRSGLSRVVRTLTGQPMNSPVPSLQVNSMYLGTQSQIMLSMCIPLLSLVIYLSHFFVPSCRWWAQRCGGAAGGKWGRSQWDLLCVWLVLSPSSCLQGYCFNLRLI